MVRERRDGKRRGFFAAVGRGVRLPFSTFPAEAVRENARLIGNLAEHLHGRPDSEPKLHRTEDGRIDLRATAFALGEASHALERRILVRRRQTARAAYVSLALGAASVVVWLWRAWTSPMQETHLLGALNFLPFCLVFFLVAFRNAHINWQLRTGELGSAGAYLRSPAPFLPR